MQEHKQEHKGCKKILIATGLYPPDIGGPATHAPVSVKIDLL